MATNENGTTIESPKDTTSGLKWSDIGILWETIFRIRKRNRFLESENQYLQAIARSVDDDWKFRIAKTRYKEFLETEFNLRLK